MLPDLLIVDGGKGQLGVAVEVLKELGLFEAVPVVGLAKQQEEIFLPGRPDSILLPRKSQGLYLVQRVRDEAHRFAITAHRTQRAKIGLASQLDAIPGVGPARREAIAQTLWLARRHPRGERGRAGDGCAALSRAGGQGGIVNIVHAQAARTRSDWNLCDYSRPGVEIAQR